ncbi:MAG: alpha-N-arabinofuranosidase, partial [Clostridia bacterium]|nr:alpha-N-arabinofuranosidase [Clostridia bacterium]
GKNLFEEQSTMRDAVITALSLNIFNNHSDKIIMTNVAQLCNNLHCLFLSDGADLITTPTYHVFDMFKEHQNAETVRTLVEDNIDPENRISVSASVKDGRLFVTAANMTLENDLSFSLELLGATGTPENAVILTADDPASHNSFDEPEKVTPKQISVPDLDNISLPHASVLAFSVKMG